MQRCEDGLKIMVLILGELGKGVPHQLQRIIPRSVFVSLILWWLISLCLSKVGDTAHTLFSLSSVTTKMIVVNKLLDHQTKMVFYVFITFSQSEEGCYTRRLFRMIVLYVSIWCCGVNKCLFRTVVHLDWYMIIC